MGDTEYVPSRCTWSIYRDADSRHRAERPAHLIALPIESQTMSTCGDRITGREWVQQPLGDSTRRCNRCEEAGRGHLRERIDAPELL